MEDPISEKDSSSRCLDSNSPKSETLTLGRREKRKVLKKMKRKNIRKEIALKELEEEEARLNDPEEQIRIRLKEKEEAEIMAREKKEFEERETLWIEAAEKRKAEEEAQQKLLEESQRAEMEQENEMNEDDSWEYVEDGPAEIIWQGNEIIVKKKRVRVAKKTADQQLAIEDADRPTSNPLPPQSMSFAAHKSVSSVSAQQVFETVAQEIPNFGTEQDKAHCPFHIKTGACRFGSRCSRVHFYPDKSCTLLIKNMYNGPGLAWEQDEGLEYTDEEVECCYEEFYEDVHTEFVKFGEIVNFKVCKNGSFHLRGNVYVHYKSLESAVLAYNSINGRYFAGRQITCEFVGVTRWKVAICGEYMKSRFKTCSHGTACNFIHCFRNPGGDYEWADWDNPPPKYWVKKMAFLFGPSDEPEYNKHTVLENQELPRNNSRKRKANSGRYHSRRSGYGDKDSQNSASGGDVSDESGAQHSNRSSRSHYSSKRKTIVSPDDHELSKEKIIFNDHKHNGKYRARGHDSGKDYYDENRDQHSSRSRRLASRKEWDFPDECVQSEENNNSEGHQSRKNYRAHDHDSDRKYSENRNRYRSSSRVHSSSRRKKVNSPSENEKHEEKSDSHNHKGEREKIYNDCDSTGVYSDESGDQYSSRLSRRVISSCLKTETSCPGEPKRSMDNELDNHERYTGGYRLSDCDPSGDYSDKTRVRHINYSSKRAPISSQKKETHYSIEPNSKLCESHYYKQDNNKIESRKRWTDNESFSSGDSYGGRDRRESDSRWEGACDQSPHMPSFKALRQITSEESNNPINSSKDTHNEHSGRKRERHHKKNEEYEKNMEDETGDCDNKNQKSVKKVSRKRLRI
ncbi:zinc finger C-x8-C-x5-C-x3-H type family protein isoform X2 [Tasmannia lanceolata]|uniref:zinc finger C-x8-C-x5-C-x3-H type family protein isoform X2 n=1 Tax=Tasmannia lanceolata TaxID=3420 RepID=UPI004062BCC8